MARAMDGARVYQAWLCAALCAASAEHALNLRRELGAQSATILPSRLRDKPRSQVEAVVRKIQLQPSTPGNAPLSPSRILYKEY